MKYVYILESLSDPVRHYTGITHDLQRRLEQHNRGEGVHTRLFRPWKILVAIRFEDDTRALAFEAYLKTGSGQAFARRHFWFPPAFASGRSGETS
ncbi:MAG: GIY-YIG nuclease family protein [Planctomycetes bacterium]|nr:GIY-YIG nuclease family protein [Planctomycetota bacterium]